MNLCNIILLVIGLFSFIMGIMWSKKNWLNVFVKIIFIFSSFYLIWYSLYLSNIFVVTRG